MVSPGQKGSTEKRGRLRGRSSSTTSKTAASSTSAWSCASIRAAGHDRCRHAFARPGPCHRLSRRWWPNGSACRFEKIRFVQGDTGQVPFGRGTYGARSVDLRRQCAEECCGRSIIEKAKPMAAQLMEAAETDIEFKEGSFRVVGTDKAIPLGTSPRRSMRPMGLADRSSASAWKPPALRPRSRRTHPNGCHVCEVEVDPETGVVEVDRYSVVDDVGRALNPMMIHGQIHGGVAQGIGQALIEHVVYDRRVGPAALRQLHGLRHAARADCSRASKRALEECRPRPTRWASRASASPARLARRPR